MKNTASTILVTLFVLASILLLLPFTGNIVVHSKMFILFFAAIILTATYVFTSIREKAMQIIVSPLTIPLALFGVASFISTQFTRQYPTENYLDLGGAFIAMTAIGLLGSVVFSKKQFGTFLSVLSIGGSVVVIDSLLQMLGFGSAQLFGWMLNATIDNTLQFTLVGSARVVFQLIVITLIGIGAHSFQEKKIDKVHLGSLLFLIIGLGLYGWVMMTNRNDINMATPSYAASWSIALDSLKTPSTAVFGIGPSNYRNAYNTFKPVWLNSTDQWTIPFSQAANAPLTILTTMGFVGLITWVWLFIVTLLEFSKADKHNRAVLAMLIAVLISQLFTTFNYVTILIQALLIALYIASERERFSVVQFGRMKANIFKSHGHQYSYESVIPLYLISLILIGVIGYSAWYSGRNYLAFATMFSSYKAAQANDIVKSYELNQKAISLSPYIDTFHRDYASTNMAIAIALSNKTDINEQEKNQVGQLLQQAVREARNATILDPNDTENWVVLAQIYGDMISVTEEAKQWAVETYARAIETNPTNPYLRILLGNIFAQLKDHQRAINLYNQAIELKPDLAEAYFRMAQSLIVIEQFAQAETALRATLSLLDSNSEEYTVVTKQLEGIQDKAKAQIEAAKATQGAGSTNVPTTSPTPTPEANVDVNAPVVPTEDDQINGGEASNDIPANDLNAVENTQPTAAPTPTVAP